MAYVAISSALLERVVTNIQQMRKAEAASLGEEPKPTLSGDNYHILKAVWREHLHLRPTTPDEWLRTVDGTRVKIDVETSPPQSYMVNVSFNPELKAPPHYDSWRPVISVSHDCPEMQDTFKYYTQLADIDVRWENVKKSVIAFLNNCKSLNEALKTWPQVSLYISRDDLERVNTKSQNKEAKESRAKEALAALNVDELVGAAVIARMSGAA